MEDLDRILHQYQSEQADGRNSERGDLLSRAIITRDDLDKLPTEVLAIEMDGQRTTMATTGTIVVVQGGPKVGKGLTYVVYLSAILSGAYGPYRSRLVGRKALLAHSDDHRYNLAKMSQKISRLAGAEDSFHPNLVTLSMSGLSQTEKFIVLESALEKYPDVGALVVDLIADWIPSGGNDEIAAVHLVDYFLKIAQRHDLVVITVVHESRLSRAARGHIGAWLVAKSSVVLRIRKRFDEFTITPTHVRGSDFPEVRFRYDGKDYTFSVGNSETEQPTRYSKSDFTQVRDHIHLEVVASMSDVTGVSSTEIRSRLREAFSKLAYPIGIGLTKELLTYYRERGWLPASERRYGTEVVLKTPPYRSTDQPKPTKK